MGGQSVHVIDKYGGLHAMVQGAMAGTGHAVHHVPPHAFHDAGNGDTNGNGDGDGSAGLSVISLCLPADELSLVRQRAGQLATPFVVVGGCDPMTVAGPVLFPGAERVLSVPMDAAVLRQLVLVLMERTVDATPVHVHGMVGASEPFRRLVSAIEQVAETDSTVLLEGETGTGKELAARAIHDLSKRSGGPFVAVDCGALSESLMESELFGHVRGAFTGATRARPGLFEAADGGTMLLDQIDDVNLSVQMRLLRTLQEWEIRRVGSVKRIPINVRLIAASRRPLKAEVEAGRFREDLYYRLKVFHVRVPPLRSRREDIDPLVDHALERLGQSGQQCSQLAWDVLRSYDWPGNIRQLLAVVESAVVQANGAPLDAHHLPAEIMEWWRSTAQEETGAQRPEPEAILWALERAAGNRSEAAALLGVSRTTLWRKMKELGLDS